MDPTQTDDVEVSTKESIADDSALTEHDKQLLKAVVTSNTELIVQMKRNRIALSRLVMQGMNRMLELVLLGVVGWGGLQLYSTLDKDAQQDLATKALHQGIPILLAVGVGKTHMDNRKDNVELDGQLGEEDGNIQSLLEGLIKGKES
jgi:hypothetical protein